MPGRKLKLERPEVAAMIDQEYAKQRDGRRKNRLLAIKLVAHGEHTSGQIARICGVSRGRLFEWLKLLREGGLAALMDYRKPGPRPGNYRGLSEEAARQMQERLAAGQFVSAVDAMRWLEQQHGVKTPYQTVWRWLKKAGGVLLVPRPSHSKKASRSRTEVSRGTGGQA